jgi:hypothetical protein
MRVSMANTALLTAIRMLNACKLMRLTIHTAVITGMNDKRTGIQDAAP